MRNRFLYKVKNNKELSEKLIFWAKNFKYSCFLYSNSTIKKMPKEYYQYEFLLGVGAHKICSSNNDSFDKLKVLHNSYKDWMFGHFSYDLKNEIDKLTSENIDNLNLYTQAIANDKSPIKGSERLNEKDHFNELIFNGLRMSTGVKVSQLKEYYNQSIENYIKINIKKWKGLNYKNGFFFLDENARLLADEIASDLFI